MNGDELPAKPRARALVGGTANPDNGARFELVLGERDEARAIYRGHAHFPERSLPLDVVVTKAAATAKASPNEAFDAGEIDTIEKAGSALVRAATRGPMQAGTALPRKIARWRPIGGKTDEEDEG